MPIDKVNKYTKKKRTRKYRKKKEKKKKKKMKDEPNTFFLLTFSFRTVEGFIVLFFYI